MGLPCSSYIRSHRQNEGEADHYALFRVYLDFEYPVADFEYPVADFEYPEPAGIGTFSNSLLRRLAERFEG